MGGKSDSEHALLVRPDFQQWQMNMRVIAMMLMLVLNLSMQQMAKARRAIDICPLLTFPPFPEIVVAVTPLS